MIKRKNSLRPIEDVVTDEEIDEMVEIPEDITESSGLDAYEKVQLNEIKKELVDNDRTKLSQEILELRQENEVLKDKVEELMKAVEKTEEKTTGETYSSSELKQIQDENDELILKNSDLEYTISQLNSEISRLNAELTTMSRKLSDFTNTNTRTPYNPTATVRGRRIGGNVQYGGLNGYEQWR